MGEVKYVQWGWTWEYRYETLEHCAFSATGLIYVSREEAALALRQYIDSIKRGEGVYSSSGSTAVGGCTY